VAEITNSGKLSGGTTEADEVLIPERDKWADQKQVAGTRV